MVGGQGQKALLSSPDFNLKNINVQYKTTFLFPATINFSNLRHVFSFVTLSDMQGIKTIHSRLYLLEK